MKTSRLAVLALATGMTFGLASPSLAQSSTSSAETYRLLNLFGFWTHVKLFLSLALVRPKDEVAQNGYQRLLTTEGQFQRASASGL